MTSARTLPAFAAALTLISIIFSTGCEQTRTADIELRFQKEDVSTYKVTTLLERKIIFEGKSKDDKKFKGGTSTTQVELTFGQKILSIDSDKNAIALITIKELKYKAMHKDKEILDFDSTKEASLKNPMAKLIGQSYVINIAPNGKIIKVTVAPKTIAMFKGNTPSQRAAVKLLSSDTIKDRHCMAELPNKEEKSAKQWSRLKDYSFGLMGEKTYERIYKLSGTRGGVTVIDMDAIPSTEKIVEMYKEHGENPMSKYFDNQESYNGKLKINLATGKIEQYKEKLSSEWIIVDPSARPDEEDPSILRMVFVQSYDLEKVN